MNTPTTLSCSRCNRALPDDAPDALCPYCLLAIGDDQATHDWTLPNSNGFTPPSVEELCDCFSELQIDVLQLHGRGGMGAVYRAHQQKLSRDVALKILPPELALAPGFDERFQREAQVLAKLNHPNIVDVYDFGKAGPYSYLLLEFVEGVNLRELMIGGEAGPSDALEIVPQLCEALQFAHDAGVVHRDVKPENILINTRGRVKITDFGIAKLASASHPNLTQTRQAMGTPQYMAPEQIERPQDVDHRADIYAMGVVFYELLTGELPLGRFDPPGRKSGTSRRLDRVVMKTLQKDPDKRFEQASEVKTEVEKEPRIDSTSQHVTDHEATWVDQAKRRGGAAIDKGRELLEARDELPLLSVVVGCLAVFTYGLALMAVLVGVADGDLEPAFVFLALSLATGIGAVTIYSANESQMGSISKSLVTPLLKTQDRSVSLQPHRWAIACGSTWIVGICTLLMGLTTPRMDELIRFGMAVLLCSFVFARWQISGKTSEALTRREKWWYYPSILTVLLPAVVTMALIVPFLAGAAAYDLSPRDASPALIAAAALAAGFGWLSLLSFIWGMKPQAVRAALRPIVNTYNGGGMYFLCVVSALGSSYCLVTLLRLLSQ